MRSSQQSMSTRSSSFRDNSQEAVLDLCVLFVIDFIVDLVREARHVSIVGGRDTLRESVLIFFMVPQRHLSLADKIRG